MTPGEYSFHVIAANGYGVWNEQGATVRFVLQPHFSQTNWFYALCGIGSLALLWMAYQFRLRQVQRAFNMRLEERTEERTRIARELHDTLLQSFQGLIISFQAVRNLLPGRTEEAIRTLDRAIREGDHAVAEGRDAIQNLRPGPAQRRLEDLLTVTGQELRDAQDGNSHPALFQVVREGQPRTLSPLLQDEIFRIAREVLRNVSSTPAQAGLKAPSIAIQTCSVCGSVMMARGLTRRFCSMARAPVIGACPGFGSGPNESERGRHCGAKVEPARKWS